MNTRDTTNETTIKWSVDAIEDLAFVQASTKEAFANSTIGRIGNTYNPATVYILFGCINTGTGLNYVISAGAVFYNGEIFTVDATTFTATSTAVATVSDTSDGDLRLFNDNTTLPVTRVRKIVIANGTTGSGASDFVNFVNIKKSGAYANVPNFTKSIGAGGATLGLAASTVAYTVISDVDSLLNTSTGVFTPKAGLYKVSCFLSLTASANNGFNINLYKNGYLLISLASISMNTTDTRMAQFANYAFSANGTDTFTIILVASTSNNITASGAIAFEPTT